MAAGKEQAMNYGNMKDYDIADGPGVRVSLFVSGCRNHCKDCFQPETWDFSYGRPFTEETEEEIIKAMAPAYVQGFTLLGGEPFEEENQVVLVNLLKRIRETYPKKDIWCYSGYTYDVDLLPTEGRKHTEATDEMLSCIDVLVDGQFKTELADIGLNYRGSRNQRVIDLKKMRETNSSEIIFWPVKDKTYR